MFEYASIMAGAFNMAADYVDTMEDLTTSLVGSAAGALLASTALHDRDLMPLEMIPQRPEAVAARRQAR